MMFQSYALFPHMTVEQNIAFGLMQDRLPAARIRERVAEMLELVRMPISPTPAGSALGRSAAARGAGARAGQAAEDPAARRAARRARQAAARATQFELVNIQERVGTTFIMSLMIRKKR